MCVRVLLSCMLLASCAPHTDAAPATIGPSEAVSSADDDAALRARAVEMARTTLARLASYEGHAWESLRSLAHPVLGLTVWIDEGATAHPTITVYQDRDTRDTRDGTWTTGEGADAWPALARQLLEWGIPRVTSPDAATELIDWYAFVFRNHGPTSRLSNEPEYAELLHDLGPSAARPPEVDLLIKNHDCLRMYFTLHGDQLYLTHIVLQLGGA